MSKTKWYAKALYLVFALALVAVALPATQPSAAAENGGDAVNTLRIYGECNVTSQFPYDDENDPFKIDNHPAGPNDGLTAKDFLVWNPAYMNHWDAESNGIYGTFFRKIVVNGNDANEKVFLKQWYVPKYEEPTGCTWVNLTEYEKPVSPDIVKEYTYLLLDTDNNPVLGKEKPELTSFVFPIADNSEQIGLDSYDAVVTDDILANQTILNYIWVGDANVTCPDWCEDTIPADKVIDISTDMLTLADGETIEFLDHKATVHCLGGGNVMVDVYYGGNDVDEAKSTNPMVAGDVLTAGRHAVHVQDGGGSLNFADPGTWVELEPVIEPWYLELVTATDTQAFVRAGRLLQEGESFFVDGAEYDVARLEVQENVGGGELDALKYITLRNPLPKYDDVDIDPLTITKTAVGPCPELIPLLPPYNMVHDIIDDINIPECNYGFDGTGNPISHADEQLLDNVIGEAIDDYGYGVDSLIHEDYNTIAERRVEDQLPAEECFIAEAKEERFDTNLLEEKFTSDTAEDWQWINIETLPWDYTEFVLPEIEDVTSMTNDDGDFILVSSWYAPNSAHDCPYDPVRVKFYFDAAVGIVNSADIYVNDAEYNDEYRGIDASSLRVYGECNVTSEFPYGEENDPFKIDNPPDPDDPDGLTAKDFLVWNPAYMNHWDAESNGIYGTFFRKIVVNGNDANEKVFLKQWYVPKYEEPTGCTWVNLTEYEKPVSPDIVKEYTYLLLDTDNNPVLGKEKPELTSFVFPIADNSEQIGLDSYDAVVTDDILANQTILNYIWVGDANVTCPDWCEDTIPADKVIDISTDMLTLADGETIEFLDHKATVHCLGGGNVMVDVYYGGNDVDEAKSTNPMVAGDVLTAGRHAVHVQDGGGSLNFADPGTWVELEPVIEPWYLELVTATDTQAFVRAGRLLQEGESFFVDGAEYDVARLEVQENVGGGELDALKYITLRNPLPKYDDVDIDPLTITKTAVGPCPELIPLLPPYNMVHDIIDDINIPECNYGFDGTGNPISHADEQLLDNVIGEAIDDYGYGVDSLIHEDYNTIAERRVEDQLPAEECFIAEAKEERFDTNLLEEKFTDYLEGEEWRWINIETLPWDYTEFVLPEIDDITGSGDYILVSSFYAPNSALFRAVTNDARGNHYVPVRVKFVYDALDGTGLYVNIYDGDGGNRAPNAPTTPSPADAATDVSLSPTLSVVVTDPDGDPMTVTFYDASDSSVIGTDTGVASGDPASVVWAGLAAETEYSWNAKANDGEFDSALSSTWSFTTTGVVYPVGDVNQDCVVNVLDMVLVGQHWGETGTPGWIPEDVKVDGAINVLDMVLIGQHFGEQCP